MLRAQDTVNRYTSQAQADMGKAKGLQAEATDLANQANAAPDKASASALSARGGFQGVFLALRAVFKAVSYCHYLKVAPGRFCSL